MTAEHRDITAEEYHRDRTSISSGMIEDFLASRRLFEGRYLRNTVAPKESSDAMKLGTHIHMRVLEPERYQSLLAEPFPELAPDGKKWYRRAGSDHERWWADEEAKRAGKIALEKPQLDRIEAIAKAVFSRRWAKHLLSAKGQAEYAIFWTDEETGLLCKILVDWFAPMCIDMKTTGDAAPSPFAKTAVRLGYHRKKAHYLAGIKALTKRDTPLLHIVVSTEPPYACGAYDLCDRDRSGKSLGERQWRRALNEIAKCHETGDWSDPWEREIVSLDLPAYAFSEDSYLM